MRKIKNDHAVMVTGGCRCTHCGDLHKIPPFIPLSDFTTLIDSFAIRHLKCKKEWQPPTADPEWPTSERIKFWLEHGEMGISAATMYNRFMPRHQLFGILESHPHDADDFRRCYLLLKTVPEWRKSLHVMKAFSPVWEKLVDNWDTLTNMLEADLANIGDGTKISAFMQSLGC